MTTPEADAEARYRVVSRVWALMLATCLVYAAFGYLQRGAGTYETGDDNNAILLFVLALVALTTGAASFFVKRAFLLKAVQQQRADVAQSGYVVAFTMSEAAALVGLIALLVTGSTYSYLMMAFGFVLLLLHKPNRDHLAAASYKNRPWS